MEEFMSFRKMITPTLVQVIYVLGSIVVGVAGLLQIVQGEVFTGVLTAAFGLLTVRIYCEVVILFFRMHQTLVEISDTTRGSSVPSSSSYRPSSSSTPPRDHTAKPSWIKN